MENDQHEIEKWVNEMFYRPKKTNPSIIIPTQIMDQFAEAIKADKSITITEDIGHEVVQSIVIAENITDPQTWDRINRIQAFPEPKLIENEKTL